MSTPDVWQITARAPAKINLVLRVGLPDSTGYHPLVTVFQAIDLWDEVTVTPSECDLLTVSGLGDVSGVPVDDSNIVWRAVVALEARGAKRTPLHIHLSKQIPVAGGMAGGSADAAATLVAVNALWGLGLGSHDLHQAAVPLGADVPFSLLGGLALGEGRGETLTPLDREVPLHVVIVRSSFELSTPAVYRELDGGRESGSYSHPHLEARDLASMGKLASGDLVHVVANDLHDPARALQPDIDRVLSAATEAGALAALVSGSGPTVWALCESAAHAQDVSSTLVSQGIDAMPSCATARGAELVSDPSAPTASPRVPPSR